MRDCLDNVEPKEEKCVKCLKSFAKELTVLQAEITKLKAEREEYLEWKKTWLESFDIMQSDLISVKDERDKLKARIERLPSKQEIGQILCEACGRGCIRFCDDFIHQRKAIHDRIHKENKCQ